MMNDMKLGIRLLRYGYGIKMNLVLLAVCVAADIFFFALDCMGSGMAMALDGYMLLALGLVPSQLIFTLNAVDMVLASPVRKKLQTSVPAVMNLCSVLGMYLIVILKKAVIALFHPDKIGQHAMCLVFLAILAAVILACTGVLYKSFIFFIALCFFISGFSSFCMRPILQSNILGNSKASLAWGALIGMTLILAGAAAEYVLSVLFYKKPVSRKTLGAKLREEL